MTGLCVICGEEYLLSELDGDGRCEWCEYLYGKTCQNDNSGSEYNWPDLDDSNDFILIKPLQH